jgi:hypothetical protein
MLRRDPRKGMTGLHLLRKNKHFLLGMLREQSPEPPNLKIISLRLKLIAFL